MLGLLLWHRQRLELRGGDGRTRLQGESLRPHDLPGEQASKQQHHLYCPWIGKSKRENAGKDILDFHILTTLGNLKGKCTLKISGRRGGWFLDTAKLTYEEGFESDTEAVLAKDFNFDNHNFAWSMVWL